MKQYWKWLVMAGLLLVLLVAAEPAFAAEPSQDAIPAADDACLTCHGDPALTYRLPSGEVWGLTIDSKAHAASIHTAKGITCTACHTVISEYPHPKLAATSIRSYQLQQYQTCKQCHNDQYQRSLDSVHARSLAAGNTASAICTDCHGAHNTTPPNQPRTAIPKACSKCHSAIYTEYSGSVHGAALTEQSNPDVPTCIDCHGVHNQEDPRTTQFRLDSPNLCARCHADKAMMGKYSISTQVFNTYVADFHGTTVTLFERTSPDLPTNKPVCYDCHGVHDMKSTKDPNSHVVQQNLVKTCQKCHPEADIKFPTSWLSHYEPNFQKYPLVFLVNLFYTILIPLVLGFMVLFVLLDIFGLLRRGRGRNHHEERV